MELTIKEGAGKVETPSQAIVNAANKTAEAVDPAGRRITIKKITLLERSRLLRVVGPELSGNMQWMGLAIVAASVTSIDGDLMAKPGTVREIEALFSLLDDDGLNAVAESYAKNFGGASQDDVIDAAKN